MAGLPPAADQMRVTDLLIQQTRAMSVRTLTTLGLFFLAGASLSIMWFAMLFAKLTGRVR